MAPHLTHVGVHDHGFNNVSTYGALWRLAREGRIDASDVGAAVLRARAEGQRRRAGAPLDDAARRRLHLFVQRRALAVRRHHPIAARAGARRTCSVTAWWRSRTRRSTCSSGSCSTRGRPRSTTCSTARGRGPLRRARPRGAREPLQRRQRHYRGPEHAAGLLAVQHLDARARVGHARLCRAARVPRDASPRRRAAAVGGRGASSRHCSTRRAPRATSISITPRAPTAFPTGTPARPGLPALGDWGSRASDPFNDHEPVDSSAAAIARAGPAAARPSAHASAAQDGSRYTQAGLRVLDTLFDEAART